MYNGYYNIKKRIFKIKATDQAIVSISLVEKEAGSNENHLIKECFQQLNQYFNKEIHHFSIPIQVQGTAFQQEVWKNLQDIPYGETRTYQQIAEKVGGKNYARAVGGACNKNPILFIIPCHRVLGSNTSLTGFAAGLDLKEYLLKHEKN